MDDYQKVNVNRRGGFVQVSFKGNRRELFTNPWEFPFKRGDTAIVGADRGQDAGTIINVLKTLRDDIAKPEFDVLRRASVQDVQRIDRLREYEKHALGQCREKIKKHSLPMKLIEAEYRFDGLKLTFFFTADSRVDFRELVRDLAGAFRTRIELRQIGARDEVRRNDGYGTCGRRLCCVSFMDCFQPITTQMAKEQNLILNPSKLSGRCGRLKCCLAFEHEAYVTGELSQILTEVSIKGEDDEKIDLMSD